MPVLPDNIHDIIIDLDKKQKLIEEIGIILLNLALFGLPVIPEVLGQRVQLYALEQAVQFTLNSLL